MRLRSITWALLAVLAWGLGPSRACAQAPALIPETMSNTPGSMQSRLGPPPGSGAVPFNNPPGAGQDVLGGRTGTASPRVPASSTMPGGGLPVTQPQRGLAPPPALPIGNIPLYGPVDVPAAAEDEGPPHGLTLDLAIERMVHENLDLKSRYFEIPQAQADVLTASLRANPLLYADSQLVPYGQYSSSRPGGPLQYDLNITYPLDVTHKRQARILVAVRARRVLEAQYQNAVRLEINNVYTAFVDVLAARETVRFRHASLAGYDQLLKALQEYYQLSGTTRAEVNRMKVQRNTTEIYLRRDQEALRHAKRTLAALLYLPPGDAEGLEVRGTLRDRAAAAPAEDELIQLALNNRPDLLAYRLGVERAQADVRLARANRLQDVYLLYQPYTFQNNQPLGQKSATSWALGLTVPLPLYNRNQGNLQRARLNVTQTETELAALMRQIITEVQQAQKQYLVTRDSVRTFEETLLREAAQMRDDSRKIYLEGEQDIVFYLNAERDYRENVYLYYDTLVQHRRSMLGLNTAVGQRILP